MFSYEYLRTTLTAASDRCIFQSLLLISFYFEYKGNHSFTYTLCYVISVKIGYLRYVFAVILKNSYNAKTGYNAKTFYAKL